MAEDKYAGHTPWQWVREEVSPGTEMYICLKEGNQYILSARFNHSGHHWISVSHGHAALIADAPTLLADNKALRESNAALREALTELANWPYGGNKSVHDFRKVARAALKDTAND